MATDPNALKSYRHSVTGLVGIYPARLGDSNQYLTEVPDDSKPLAYTPIPHEAVEAYLAAREESPETHDTESGEKDSSTEQEEE